ncbi:MAG: DNA gyrase subunit A, partial [Alphaproteobacteria bacterium]
EKENFILSVTAKGYGKRTSSYEYRTSKRGGQGVWNMKLGKKNGTEVVRSFCVEDGDQIMMVTDGGQIIRMPVDGIRFAGRQTQGVTLFRVAEDEEVVSVAVVRDDSEDEDTDENLAAATETEDGDTAATESEEE